MTVPGVPCIYYGDEIGMEGGRDPDNRRCMSWDQSTWDHDLRYYFKRLIQLRRTAPALRYGGFQMLYAQDDLLIYQRQSAEQRIIVVAHRGTDTLKQTLIPIRHAGISDGTTLSDQLTGFTVTVEQGSIHIEGLAAGNARVLSNDIIYIEQRYRLARTLVTELTPVVTLISTTFLLYSLFRVK